MTKFSIKIILIMTALAAAIAAGFYFAELRAKNQLPAGKTVVEPEETPATSTNTIFAPSVEAENPADRPDNPRASDTDPDITDAVTEPVKPESNEIAVDDAGNGESAKMERFTIAIGQNAIATVAHSLREQEFIDDEAAFKASIDPKILALVAGGYKLSKDMNEARVAATLQEKPYMKWIIIPEGLRKEEVARILADELGWTAGQQKNWIDTDTTVKSEYIEGVYFPDTYLIPVDEAAAKVAERMQSRFNEAFAVFFPQFNEQNIKWTTGLTFASIVQREAKNAADMPLIAGILWKRLEQGMALNADATLQYARGNTGSGWWATATVADKVIDSPFNTYTNKGMPPHAICSPGINAIEATLNPATTDCLYYLHGNDGRTHCAVTYEEHLQNIETYLKTVN